LKGTTSFTHIAQMKMPGDGSTPIYVMSLRRNGDKQHIEAKIFQSNTLIGETDLEHIHDKWVEVELEFHVHESTGSAKWTLISDGKTLVHGEKTHVKTFMGYL
jgi:chitin-binding protein